MLIAKLQLTPGVQVALTRKQPARNSSSARSPRRDIVVISTRHVTSATAPEKHDLSGLTEPLRSHGGLTEQRVPMISNRKLKIPSGHRLRTFDAFWVALNCVEA